MDDLSYDSLKARPLRVLSQLGPVHANPSFKFTVPWNTDSLHKIANALLGAEETVIARSGTSFEDAWEGTFGSRRPDMSSKSVSLIFRQEGVHAEATFVTIEHGTLTLDDGTVIDPIVTVHINPNDYAENHLIVIPSKDYRQPFL